MTSVTFKTSLSAQEQDTYGQKFRELDPEDLGIVTGESVKGLFSQSGLSAHQLSQIWMVCDNANQGFLNLPQFSAAMRLIGHLQANPSLPISSELYQNPAPQLASMGVSNAGASTTGVSNTSSATANTTSIPPVTPYDASKFSQLFDRSTNGAPALAGDKAKDIFLKAKLPNTTLGSIWSLCDRENSGSLDKTEFIMAMHLIQLAMANNPAVATIPDILPGYLWDSVNASSLGSAPLSTSSTGMPLQSPVSRQPSLVRVPSSTFTNAASDWTLSPEKKQQFDAIFDSLDKSRAGTLSSQALVPFFLSSRLSQDVLASVWDLADIYNNAEFSKLEFAIAMFLIQKKKSGIELPDVVPDQLLRSPALGLHPAPSPQQPGTLPNIPSRNTKPTFSSPPQASQRNQSALGDLLTLNESFSSPQPASIRVPSDATGNSVGSVHSPTVNSSTAGLRKFQPSSTFGQSIIQEETSENAPSEANQNHLSQQFSPPPQAQQQQIQQDGGQALPQQQLAQHPPPSFTQEGDTNLAPFQGQSSAPNTYQTGVQNAPRSVPQPTQSSVQTSALPSIPNLSSPPLQRGTRDMSGSLDGDTSLQLSHATTELANLSNQVGSLTNQATLVNERKARAQQELKRINDLKSSIETKMVSLRGSYQSELKQTEETEALLSQSRQQVEELKRELAIAEANYHAVQGSLAETQRQLEESEQTNSQLKEKIGNLNAMTASLQNELNEKQQKAKQERSMVDVNSRQMEVSQMTTENLQNEIQGLEQHLAVFIQKHKELEDYRSTLEAQHGELNSRHQQLESRHGEISRGEQEVQQRSLQLKEQEQIYHEEIAKLQSMFNDLNTQRESLAKAEDELQHQQFEYAQKVQDLSERRMKLAMGELPEDAELITKDQRGFDSNQDHVAKFVEESVSNSRLGGQEDDDKQGSDVFDKDIPTVGSQTEVDEEDRRTDDDETAAQALADRFDGDLNEYRIPRTESLTSSVLNNPPQSVRDDAEVELDAVTAAADAGPRNAADDQVAKTAEAVDSNMPGGWAGKEEKGSTNLHKNNQTEGSSSADMVSEVETLNKHSEDAREKGASSESVEKAIDQEFPPIQELDINESDSESSQDEEDEDFKDPEQEIPQPVLKKEATDLGNTSVPVDRTEPTAAASAGGALSTADQVEPHTKSDIKKEVELAEKTLVKDNLVSPEEPEATLPSSGQTTSKKPEVVKDASSGYFDDEFAGLEQAAPEEEPTDQLTDREYSEGFETIDHKDLDEELNQGGFTGVSRTGVQAADPEGTAAVGADEWDEIFAGFGNGNSSTAATRQPASVPLKVPTPTRAGNQTSEPPVNRGIATTPKSLAIEELESMGFTTEEATKALEHCNWDLGAATNYLLDSS